MGLTCCRINFPEACQQFFNFHSNRRVCRIPRRKVFRALHEPAHYGYDATLRRISQRFWWPRIRSEFLALVKACETCDRDCNFHTSPCALLVYLSADQSFETLYIYIVGGQGSLLLGVAMNSILTMIDKLRGWAQAVQIVNQFAATVARAVHAEWFARYGVPKQLYSNGSTHFESALFSELC